MDKNRSMDTALLRVEGLTKEFKGPDNRPIRAVSHVSFSIGKGETLGLVGESGCGKSTLARALMLLPGPDSGRILFNVRENHTTHALGGPIDLAAMAEKKLRRLRPRFQMVFQDSLSSLNPRRTIQETLAAPLNAMGITQPTKTKARVLEMLSCVGMEAAGGHLRPHQLSGGQCQRIQIARALMTDPELLICDEPVSALDVSIQAQILNLLADLRDARNLTMLFISHDLAVVKHICDKVAVMHQGILCEEAPCDTLYDSPCHPYTQALLAAVPTLDPHPVPEDLPGIGPGASGEISLSHGCSYRIRCPRATHICGEIPPPFRRITPHHKVACHHP